MWVHHKGYNQDVLDDPLNIWWRSYAFDSYDVTCKDMEGQKKRWFFHVILFYV